MEANRPVDNYWIRALPDVGASGLPSGFDNGTNSAILRYKGAPAVEPTSNQTTNATLLSESQLHPLKNPRAPGKPRPGGADHDITLNLSFNGTRFFVNNATYESPPTPVLLQMLSGAYRPEALLPAGSIYYLPRNKTIEVTIPGVNFAGLVSDEVNQENVYLTFLL